MTGNRLYDYLKQFSLDKYSINFQTRGIHDYNDLLSLTMQDYPSLGITTMKDREKLFHLIQNVKAREKNNSTVRQKSAEDFQQKSSNVLKGQRCQENSSYMGYKSVMKDKKLATKSTTEGFIDSPSLEKINSKTQILKKPRISEKPAKSPNTVRSKTDVVTTEVGYNYGVPSSKPKLSTAKRSANQSAETKIRVCVRKRPLSVTESLEGELDIVEVLGADTITVCAPKVAVDLTKYTQKYPFVFDEAFDETCSNEEVYARTAKPLIKTVFNRGKATCFAYGCTGSGKTHTMLGNDKVQGLYVLAARDMFFALHSRSQGDGLGLWVSFYEIYCGQLFDLLNGRAKLHARENANHKVCITSLTELEVRNVEELMQVIDYGNTVRSTGSTGVNADSSRSHAILQLEVKGEKGTKQVGRFSFIDLAGSERAADVTDTDKLTRMEGAEINQSLLALKECIRALDQDSKHTPFRQSKLTQVLKDSFVGNSHTCMIANISPNMSASENTLNTLRYADRAKELRKEEILTSRPGTVGRTKSDNHFCRDDGDFKLTLNNNLPKLKVEEIGSGTRSDNLNKALNRLKMSDMDNVGNLRPKTTADLSCRETHSPARRTRTPALKASQSRKNTSVTQSYNLRTPIKHLAPTVRPLTSPAVTPSRSRDNIPKPKSLNSLLKSHDDYVMPPTNLARNIDTVQEEDILRPQSVREQSVGSSQFVCTRVSETEVNVPRTSNNLDFNEEKKARSKSKPKRELQEVSSRQKPKVSLECPSSASKLEESLPLKCVDDSSPIPNTRYSNSIKARLSRLFNGKTTDSRISTSGTGKLSVDRINPEKDDTRIPQSLHETNGMKRCLDYSVLNSEHEHLTLTKKQIVAAHHTQLALITGLCQEEMVLLRKVDSNDQSFSEYISQLDDILSRKASCIDALRCKIASYSAK